MREVWLLAAALVWAGHRPVLGRAARRGGLALSSGAHAFAGKGR
ncbi:MAG TPA: hypothetical protein VHZ26_02785 [Caulobacteraceae bacterium]|nr:hypothetical protein [Caulobacteraceae bacterium]